MPTPFPRTNCTGAALPLYDVIRHSGSTKPLPPSPNPKLGYGGWRGVGGATYKARKSFPQSQLLHGVAGRVVGWVTSCFATVGSSPGRQLYTFWHLKRM